ncbi:hypothetical protein EZS27_024567 [termite gut metagenome]|uniref:Uncharacterized protein n=1 Tax=termite gut metagenome TaxID=433724 RepID=A0A5J4QWS3_9ZZZZ
MTKLKTTETIKTIETRKNEIRFQTRTSKEMLGKYLAENLRRVWMEDFVDEDTGETVSMERSEMIGERGALIDQDLLSRILFFLESKDIESVEVSNQQRKAFGINGVSSPWFVTAQGTKKTSLVAIRNFNRNGY